MDVYEIVFLGLSAEELTEMPIIILVDFIRNGLNVSVVWGENVNCFYSYFIIQSSRYGVSRLYTGKRRGSISECGQSTFLLFTIFLVAAEMPLTIPMICTIALVTTNWMLPDGTRTSLLCLLQYCYVKPDSLINMVLKLGIPHPCGLLTLILMSALCSLSDCYDPLDPTGNITVTFDIEKWTSDGYVARVTIRNYYQYRHVDEPGWKVGWTWAKNEVIWFMSGAFATQQGNCSAFKFQIPHSCKKDPFIIDLMPDAPYQNRSDYCCKAGVLSSWAIDPDKSFSSFEMMVGNLGQNLNHVLPPLNLTLMAPGPGYTCGPLNDADPSVSSDVGGKREVQVYRTWKSTCTYSTFLANKTPTCCVSLSTFYNPKVTPCANCSCGCREANKGTDMCIREGETQGKLDSIDSGDLVRCTDHMCPVRVHWHIMKNYLRHWRVKVTISNYNYKRAYSNWNVLIQHPGFSQKATAYSFNNTILHSVGYADEIALFWGINGYNDELLESNETFIGSEITEILLYKDLEAFTFRNGWGFPRKVYFNGEVCGMPLPDTFPILPNETPNRKPLHRHNLSLLIMVLIMFVSGSTQNLV